MTNKLCVYIVCLFLAFMSFMQTAYAQRFAPDYWHEGGVIFPNNDTLTGRVYYSLADNTVQLDDQEAKHFYNAFKLKAIYFENAIDSTCRTFEVLNFELENGYEVPQFFEKLYEDSTIVLYGRERLIFIGKGSGASGFNQNHVTMGYDFYIRKAEGKVLYVPNKKKDFIALFSDHEKQITTFIKKEKSDLNNLEDIKAIIAFYHKISSI